MLRLVTPSAEYKESFLEGLQEFQDEEGDQSYDLEQIEDHFAEFLCQFEKERLQDIPNNERAPESAFWLVHNKRFIGRVYVRHALNQKLHDFGGHIGYNIRPSERRKGYGKKALGLALIEAKKLDLHTALITCNEDNLASKKIIEANGGVLQDVIETELNPGKRTMRWWIDV